MCINNCFDFCHKVFKQYAYNFFFLYYLAKYNISLFKIKTMRTKAAAYWNY